MAVEVASPQRFGQGGRFELQPLERRLLVDGEPATLGARAFDLLLELASRPGALRTKHELIEAVWPGVVVEEGNLATQISTLRKILGGDVIATIPGRGYRFAAQVTAQVTAVGAGTSSGPPVRPAPAEPAAAPAAAPAPAAKLRTNLPAAFPPLIGRADDLAALAELVAQHRLVRIVGAGGVGKTRLAQTFLHERRQALRHGVCFVDLALVSDPALVPAAVIAALGLGGGSGDPLESLCGLCTPLQMLVALDNAEHLLEATAQAAQALVEAAPGVRLLVTSQAPLKVAAECVYRLGALAVPPGPLPLAEALTFGAVQLFADRAQAVDSRLSLTDAGLPAVIEVCCQLDGLPLAIELAAARAPMLGVHKLAASLGERLKLLTSGRNRLAPAGQQTLRAALEWSHGFLDEAERTVFRRLAVFAGSGSLTMIQQVVADPVGELDEWAVLDALALLVDRSLVGVIDAGDAAEPRYRLLDSPRVFALEQLRAAGDEQLLRQRHLQAVAAFCEAAEQSFHGGNVGRREWLHAFTLDVDNAKEALQQAIAVGEGAAAVEIGDAWLRHAQALPMPERLAVAEHCGAQLDDTVPPALQVRHGLSVAAVFGDVQPRRALDAARQARALLQRWPELGGDRFLRCRVACRLAKDAAKTVEMAEAQAALAEAQDLEDPRSPRLAKTQPSRAGQ